MKAIIRVKMKKEWIARVLDRGQAETVWKAILVLGKAWGFKETEWHDRKRKAGSKPERTWRDGVERVRAKSPVAPIEGKVVAYATFFVRSRKEYVPAELLRYNVTLRSSGKRVVRYQWGADGQGHVGRAPSENPDEIFWYAQDSKLFSEVRWAAGSRNASVGPRTMTTQEGKRITVWK